VKNASLGLLLALGAISAPDVCAQPVGRPYRIGILHEGYLPAIAQVQGLKAGLKAAGLEEGRDVTFEVRPTRGTPEAAPAAAAEHLAQFEAAGAQVVGVSVDIPNTLEAFVKANGIRHPLLSDFGRKMLPAYGVMVTDEKSPIYRYAKRSYFILDRQGVLRWMKIQDNPLDLLKPEDVLKALKESGA